MTEPFPKTLFFLIHIKQPSADEGIIEIC